jgi:Rps23 Pro-64 3,4-dihydroxylase Tpa1-like proline 4-hydroxylase
MSEEAKVVGETQQILEPTEVVGGCIAIYRNIWENVDEDIASIEEYSNDSTKSFGFIPATTLNDFKGDGRTNYHMCLNEAATDSETMDKLSKRYFDLVLATSLGFNKYFNINEPIFLNEPFNVLKYQTGQEYKSHYDGGSASARTISPILYLNDDYEGGDIEFVNFNIKIKPEKGMLILFPASYPYMHIAHPVTSGTKYAIVNWLHDRPWDNISKMEIFGNASV